MKNKYGFLNNKFVLVKYLIEFEEVSKDEIVTHEDTALSDEQLDKIKLRLDKQNIKYTVKTVDNSSIEWIVDADIDNNLIEKAIELGEDNFYDYMYENDDNAQRDNILLQILSSVELDNSTDLIEKTYTRLSKNKSVSKKRLNQQFSRFKGDN